MSTGSIANQPRPAHFPRSRRAGSIRRKKAWLPILHTQRGDRHYTAMFSNTARAHRLGTTHDWVILYQDGESGAHQCTVITSHQGPLEGRRIVRGREAECQEYFERLTPHARRGMAN